jgi:hypothetical protein
VIYTIGLGDMQAEELNRLLSPVSVLIDIRHSGPHPPAGLQTPVDVRPRLGGITVCEGGLRERTIDDWLHDHVQYGIPNPWTYLEIYAYMFFTLTTIFALEISTLRFDGVCFLCNQEDWWLCHRAVLADYLGFHGEQVTHLGRRRWEHRHYLTGRLERYDPRVLKKWEDRANA